MKRGRRDLTPTSGCATRESPLAHDGGRKEDDQVKHRRHTPGQVVPQPAVRLIGLTGPR